MKPRKVIAYQLSLLGDKPKACRAWEPSFWTWCLGGDLHFPATDDAMRQITMLTRESRGEASA